MFSTILMAQTTLKIATYNVENLFDLKKSGHEYFEYRPYSKSGWNKRTYNIKLKNISRIIKDINADIIALEEIESLQALKDLRKRLQRDGLYYKYYKIANKKTTTVKVAVLSKYPFNSSEIGVTSTYSYRNILECKFNINNEKFYLFINHWKSKAGAESKRVLSAKYLYTRLRKIGLDKNIIIVGDFNSDYEEYKKFKRKRRLNDTNGITGINHKLHTILLTNRAKNYINIQNDNYNLYNLWYDTAKKNRFSYIYRKKKEALDNIIISQPLLNKKHKMHYKYSSIHSFKKSYFFFHNNYIYRWQMTHKRPRIHKAKGFSDHLAVIAEFVIK